MFSDDGMMFESMPIGRKMVQTPTLAGGKGKLAVCLRFAHRERNVVVR